MTDKAPKTPQPYTDWRALLYGLALQHEGHSLAELARLVARRYPHTRQRMMQMIEERGEPWSKD